MKSFIAIFFFVYAIPLYAQQAKVALLILPSARLVASSSKHIRRYVNGELIKIHYHIDARIIKAKGIVNIIDSSHVQLLPVRKGTVVTISVDSISSIGLWKRRGKIDAAIFGGTALLAAGVAELSINPNRPLGSGTDVGDFLLILYSFGIGFYEGIALPSIYLSEWISTRSEKRGYHFYIDRGSKK